MDIVVKGHVFILQLSKGEVSKMKMEYLQSRCKNTRIFRYTKQKPSFYHYEVLSVWDFVLFFIWNILIPFNLLVRNK